MKISDHATRISSQVMGQKRVGGRACDLIRALRSAARPTACTATVAATRRQAKRIFESTVRGCPRQTLADKDLMSSSDMDLVRWIVRFVLLNGFFTEIEAAKGKASSRRSDTPSAPTLRQ